MLVALLDVAVRGEDRIEREAVEAAEVHPGHRQPVARDADEADETLVAGLDGRFERAAFAECSLPFDRVDEVVQLEQVDMVDAEAVERAPDLLARTDAIAQAGLRCEEDTVAMPGQPRRKSQL